MPNFNPKKYICNKVWIPSRILLQMSVQKNSDLGFGLEKKKKRKRKQN
jgi:hypothetical protein